MVDVTRALRKFVRGCGQEMRAWKIEHTTVDQNPRQSRDPEMHQARRVIKGTSHEAGHLGVDSQRLGSSASVTAGNVQDVQELPHLVHGWADAALWRERLPELRSNGNDSRISRRRPGPHQQAGAQELPVEMWRTYPGRIQAPGDIAEQDGHPI